MSDPSLFVEALTGDASTNMRWRALCDDARADRLPARNLYGSFASLETELRALNAAGYGIFATRDLSPGEIVFAGEERNFRLVSRQHLDNSWSEEERETARHYAIPFSSQLLAFWDRDPDNWAPQNHSCDPNTAYRGLDVVALRDIACGQELTLDYSRLCDESIPAFPCRCGAAICRGEVRGTPGFSLTAALETERARSRG